MRIVIYDEINKHCRSWATKPTNKQKHDIIEKVFDFVVNEHLFNEKSASYIKDISITDIDLLKRTVAIKGYLKNKKTREIDNGNIYRLWY